MDKNYAHHLSFLFVVIGIPVLFMTNTSMCFAQEHMWVSGVGNPKVNTLTNDVIAITGLYHTAGEAAGVSAGIIFTKESVIFIDAGMTIASAEFIWATAQEHMADRENLYLILTHHHGDHIFGMRIFKEKGATVVAQSGLKMFLENKGKNYKQILVKKLGWDETKGDEIFGDVLLSLPDWVFEKDTVLTIDGEAIHLLFTPGHVFDEISIYHPRSKTLFTGDAVYQGMKPTTHFGGPAEWREWITQLERIKKLDIETVVPGHGILCTKDELDRNIEYLEDLLTRGTDH